MRVDGFWRWPNKQRRSIPVEDYTTDVVVEFRSPGVDPAKADSLRAAYLRLYDRLWEQDAKMMVERQKRLDAGFRDTSA
jgi:hypothetical protein